jgi:hypothetical protein
VAYSLFDDLSVLLARLFGRAEPEPASRPGRDATRDPSGGPGKGGNGETQWLKPGQETVVVHRQQPAGGTALHT